MRDWDTTIGLSGYNIFQGNDAFELCGLMDVLHRVKVRVLLPLHVHVHVALNSNAYITSTTFFVI
uniref:Uncharacterized protein n=1 Tax=Rhizophora mucronata TaxID=61149 RepID=A0A2P2QN63_RHIMU